jgi:hypothetical protein
MIKIAKEMNKGHSERIFNIAIGLSLNALHDMVWLEPCSDETISPKMSKERFPLVRILESLPCALNGRTWLNILYMSRKSGNSRY